VTYAGKEGLIPAYIESVIKEATFQAHHYQGKIPVKSIYFGGGTPSIVPVKMIGRILEAVHSHYQIDYQVETSIELNPGTIHENYFNELRSLGVNRLSMGMQSAHDDELKLLGRIHQISDVKKIYSQAREAGFSNISFDLIYGLPDQTIEKWMESVQIAVDLSPEHLSLYCLTIEPGTPFGKLLEEKRITPVDDDLAASMYSAADQFLNSAGFIHYEISNWAKISQSDRSFQSIHNIQYWLNEPYLGFGAGAHGCTDGWRLANSISIEEYVQRMKSSEVFQFPFSPATVDSIKIDPYLAMQETMMLGLRLLQKGVDLERFYMKHGERAEEVFSKEIGKLLKRGLIEFDNREHRQLKLTTRGILLANQAFIEFVGD
jgi:oxygen-independent coproporphyrinogen-3 oxidase